MTPFGKKTPLNEGSSSQNATEALQDIQPKNSVVLTEGTPNSSFIQNSMPKS